MTNATREKIQFALREHAESYRVTILRGTRCLYITPDYTTKKAAILAAKKFLDELKANEEAHQLAREAMQAEIERIDDLFKAYRE